MKNQVLPRVLISLLGVAFIFMAASEIMLGLVGKSRPAVVTSIRREGGERDEVIPGRYTYNISYTFTLPDGREISGFTKKIGDSVFLKADGKSTVQIRYLSAFPFINMLEKDSGFGMRQAILVLVGGLLIFLINHKWKTKRNIKRKK